MILIPIWMIVIVGVLFSFSIAYNLILRHQRAVLVKKAEGLRTRMSTKIHIDGSLEAVKQAEWNLAYQITQAQSNQHHEDIAKLRERGR